MQMIENEKLEFKREYNDRVIPTIIAFANTEGGELYIGVDDNGKHHKVKHIDDLILKISNEIDDKIVPDIKSLINISLDMFDGDKVIKITVREGTSKPYYLKSKGPVENGVYLRIGTSTKHASKETILDMILLSNSHNFEDGVSAVQNLTFTHLERVFKRYDIKLQKRTLGLTNQKGEFTNLAYLLSDQNAHSVRLARFAGKNKMEFLDRDEFTGSIFEQFEQIEKYFSLINKLPAKIIGMKRIENKDYPEVAIRESLLNLLIHRDYAINASAFVNIYNDRIEFVNFGGLVSSIKEKEAIYEGISISRNPKLASIFLRLSLVEAYGTGIPKIINSYNNYIQKPLIKARKGEFRVQIPNTNKITENTVDEKILATLSDNQLLVFAQMRRETPRTRVELEGLTGLSSNRVGHALDKLKDLSLVKLLGEGRNSVWFATPADE